MTIDGRPPINVAAHLLAHAISLQGEQCAAESQGIIRGIWASTSRGDSIHDAAVIALDLIGYHFKHQQEDVGDGDLERTAGR